MQYRTGCTFAWILALTLSCGDNNEQATPPDACARQLWYGDSDGDGDGNANTGVESACVKPAGYVETQTDCDDGDPAIFADAIDTCGDGIDQDCKDGDALCFAELDGWMITSGRIVEGSTPAFVTGSLTFTKLSGDAETRGGGGCLVADLVALGSGSATCTSDADCTTSIANGYGYCASPDGSGEAKRCWTRPGGPDLCVRSMANTPGEQMLPEVAWDVAGDGTPVRWMIVACLAEEATPGACGSTTEVKYVRSHGPASTRM
jgi:hypothetical protein